MTKNLYGNFSFIVYIKKGYTEIENIAPNYVLKI